MSNRLRILIGILIPLATLIASPFIWEYFYVANTELADHLGLGLVVFFIIVASVFFGLVIAVDKKSLEDF